LPTSERWTGSVGLTGNVTVPSGKVLTLASGATVSLNNYYIKCTGGEIEREGNVSFQPKDVGVESGSNLVGQYSSIQSAIDNASSGQSVCVGSSTYSESIDMKSGVEVIGANKNNTLILGTVTFENTNGSELSYLTVNDEIHINSGTNNRVVQVNTEERIVCNYGSNHYFATVTANHTDKYGIKAYGTSSVDVVDFTSTGSSQYGVYGSNSSYLDLETDPNYYLYKITDKDFALQITSYSDASLEYVRFEHNSYDIYAAATASAIACDCSITGDVYGDVTIDDPQWCGGSLSKQSGDRMASSENSPALKNSSISQVQNAKNVSDFYQGVTIFRETNKQVKLDYSLGKEYQPEKYQSEYQLAIDEFKKVVSESHGTSVANKSLAYISWSYWGMKQTENLKAYLESLIKDEKYNGSIEYHAEMLIAPINVCQKEYDLAI